MDWPVQFFCILIIFCSLTSYLNCVTIAPSPDVRKLAFYAVPAHPVENQETTLICAVTQKTKPFHYMELRQHEKNQVSMYKYEENEVVIIPPYKETDMTAKFIKWNLTMLVKFTATVKSNGRYKCVLVKEKYPLSHNDLEAYMSLWVQRKPEVSEFYLNVHSRRTPVAVFNEGDRVKSTCKVLLGYPEANVSLQMFGNNLLKEMESDRNKDQHSYNKTTAVGYVEVTHVDNGKIFNCSAKNTHGVSHKEIRISVRFKVRRLYFPYENKMEFTVGTYLECFAQGNPLPTINITATPVNVTMHSASLSVSWGRQMQSLPFGKARRKIPRNAATGQYRITCNARNLVDNKVGYAEKSFLVFINAPITQGSSYYVATIVLGVLLVLVLLVLIFQFCLSRRQNHTLRRQRSRMTELESAHSLLKRDDKQSISDIDREATTLPVTRNQQQKPEMEKEEMII